MRTPLSGLLLTILFGTMTSSQYSINSSLPPIAETIAKVDTVHGNVRTDNYYWLREKSNPEVIKYLEAENAYMAEMMKPTEELQQTIYNKIIRCTILTDPSVPYRLGRHWDYTHTEGTRQSPIYCCKCGPLVAAEEITLGVNQWRDLN